MIFNKCCFKIKGFSYLMIFGGHFTDVTKCTDSNGKQLNTTLLDAGRCKFIKFHDNLPSIINIITEKKTFENIQLHFPFENAFPQFKNDTNINIISTMCRKYNFRLDEWIKYHLDLGVDGILIFDNTNNNGGGNNGGDQDDSEDMKLVTDKYGDKVYVFDYPDRVQGHWNQLQALSICTGINAMKHRCRYIAITDADEFITVANNNFKEFCNSRDKTFEIPCTKVTNKSYCDVIDNNILSLCKYIHPKRDNHKLMIRTSQFLTESNYTVDGISMIWCCHRLHGHRHTDGGIHLYHCWVNERLKQIQKEREKIGLNPNIEEIANMEKIDLINDMHACFRR